MGVVGLSLPFVVQYAAIGAWRAFAGMLLGECTALVGLILLRRGAVSLAAHLVVFALWAPVLATRFDVGGFSDTGTSWFLLVPLVSGVLLSTRDTLHWTMVAALTIAGLAGFEYLGYVPPNLIGDSAKMTHALINYAGIMGAISLVVIGYVGAQRKSENQMFDAQVALRAEIVERRNAEEAAIRASRAKDDFLATISHEIRTPMNGIIGMNALLLERDLAPVERDYAETVRASAEALHDVITDILDFSEIEAGKLEMVRSDFDLQNLLEDVRDVVSVGALEKNLELTLRIAPDVPQWVAGDPARLRQVLSNLLDNAVKFTEQGEVEIGVERNAGDQIRFIVRDSGIGIAPEILPLLFEPFTQADSSNTRRYGGTGLGLSIARRLARAMDGDIEVRSQAGEGSTFELWGQFAAVAAVIGPKSTRPEAPAPPVAAASRSAYGRILVVDDNAINRKVAARILQRLGFEVDVANDGAEGVRRAMEETYATVLMDCQMPVMDGYEATRRIHQLLGDKRPLIIALTAGALPADRARAEAAGMDGFLTKPISSQTIEAALGCAVDDELVHRRRDETILSDRHARSGMG